MKDDLVSQKGMCLANSFYLWGCFELNRMSVYLEKTLGEVREDSIVCKDKNRKAIVISCDSVISSAGYISVQLAEKSNYLVGDCLSIGNLHSGIWRAYEVAMKIMVKGLENMNKMTIK